MEERLIINFLVRSTIPKVSDPTRLPETEESNLIWDAVYRAHRDVLTGRGYVSEYSGCRCENKATVNCIAQKLYFEIRNATKPEQMTSEYLISCLENFKIPLGQKQKLVNMTLKYLFILQELKYLEENKYDIPIIVEKNCDCPLDSIILSFLGEKEVRWTRIESLEEYKRIEDKTKKEVKGIKTKLEYDFKNWTDFQECPWKE